MSPKVVTLEPRAGSAHEHVSSPTTRIDSSDDVVSEALAGIQSLTEDTRRESSLVMLDDGLGCIRAMAFVFAFDIVILGLGSLGWKLWHLLH
jgi:hypothetical protein